MGGHHVKPHFAVRTSLFLQENVGRRNRGPGGWLGKGIKGLGLKLYDFRHAALLININCMTLVIELYN